MTWKKIIKSNWREQARGDLETPAELIILQQSLFYMEELLKMMKKKKHWSATKKE